MIPELAPKAEQDTNRIRVLIVDDSAVIRGVIARMLEGEAGITIVGSAQNGAIALGVAARTQPDVVILDIEMPVMDGLTAIPRLLEVAPGVRIIMASTLTQRGAEISLDALRLGAADYIPKPGAGSIIGAAEFKRELTQKVEALGRARVRKRDVLVQQRPTLVGAPVKVARLRTLSRVRPAVVGIGSSTGGPQALLKILSSVPPSMSLPIVIVQHMPPTFTRILAEQLGRAAKREAVEVSDLTPLRNGVIHVAPGGFHMIVERGADGFVLRTNTNPPENFCRPAVDPLFRSLAASFGAGTLAIVLTGMGSDGARGATVVADAGGTVLAQDEDSSVVWGMPGATAAAGACAELLPLGEISRRIVELVCGACP